MRLELTDWQPSRATISGMVRPVFIVGMMFAVSACAAEPSRNYVVRLDLDKIAAQTAARDAAPGFSSLKH